ncbi:MAG: beta-N-acetylhexosaminidase [Wenzhouxiangella sp.]|nr:MAG: beta-N-acetylhexosaminidase [Wenzhouxiangella sp.]
MTAALTTGRLIVGFEGLALDPDWRERLCHPAVGGVILFARNFASVDQVRDLVTEIRALKSPRLLVTVDQEGGRVQRFRAPELTPLPALGLLGKWFEQRPDRARDLAYRHGRVMAAEMLGLGIDLSWAPVLDLDRGSRVIGDRAMSGDPATVADLGGYYVAGMKDAGMAACGKHFPGHGSVAADSHLEVVTDARPRPALEADLQPFAHLADKLSAVMMAHVLYPAVDPLPAGFSARWVVDELRQSLGFEGLVVSDDLDMAGAGPAGGLGDRLAAALGAGCDLALVCNPQSVAQVLTDDPDLRGLGAELIGRLHGRAMSSMTEQLLVPEFRAWRESLDLLSRNEQ